MRLFNKSIFRNFINSHDRVNKTSQSESQMYEKCVICGRGTNVLKNKPIEEREEYIVGAGQLCWDCYMELYKKADCKE